MIDRSALDAALAAAEPPELLALAGELQGRAWAQLAPQPGHVNGADAPDEALDVEEAARRTGMSPSWLYKNGRRLPFAAKQGRRVVFSARGIERWRAARMRS